MMSSAALASIKNIFFSKKERNIIIDPFSCLIKLCVLKHMQRGTKISIYENKIFFSEPSYIQGAVRFLYGDGREDLHNLFTPIQKCVAWFWKSNEPDIEFIFNGAISGLRALKTAYSTWATIQITIDYYILILNQKTPVILDQTTTETPTTTTEENDTHTFLKSLWNEREMSIVINLFKELESKSGHQNEYEAIKANIMQYCAMKEAKLHQFIEARATLI